VLLYTSIEACNRLSRRPYRSVLSFSYMIFRLYYYTIVSKRIIDLHGGRIGVSSPGEGLGSTFFFEIPVVDKTASKPRASLDGKTVPSGIFPLAALSAVGESKSDRILRVRSAGNMDVKVVSGDHFAAASSPGLGGILSLHSGFRANPNLISPVRVGDDNDDDVCVSTVIGNGTSMGRPRRGNVRTISKMEEEKVSKMLSILLVDDASSNRKMIRRVLNKSLFIPDEAEDGLVAVSKVSQMVERGEANYDVILMDFMMPKMDGPTATRAIRGLGYTGIIIGVTGNSSPQDLEMFQISGADLVMPKPFDMDQLVANISSKFRRCNISVSFEFSTILKQCISFHLELLLKRSLVPKAAHGTVTPLTSHSILLPQEF